MIEPDKNTLITIRAIVDQEQLEEIERFGMVLLKERPGLCWEVPLEPEEKEEK